jgi:hypothetical protein
MISLADLRARKVTPIWQESVAVVQELIQTVKATTGSAELLPDLGHVALIPNGDVVAIPGSPEPVNPVRHAAVLLQLLIEGVPAPPELEQFVARNVAQPPQYDTVAEFSRNLAFFERPGRRSDVERLVARALAADQTSRADEELQRLKDRASAATQVMPPPEFLQQQEKVKTVPVALVAAIGVVTIAVGLWLWTQVRASQAPASAAADAAASAGQAQAAEQAATGEQAPPAGQAATAPSSPDANAGGPATGATAQPPAAGSTTGVAAAPAPTAPPGDRSLLGRASDAVRSAVNTIVGSTPSPTPAVATTPKPSTEAKMAAAPSQVPSARPRGTPKKAAVTPAPAAVAAAPPAPGGVPAAPEPVLVAVPIAMEPAPRPLGPEIEEAIEVFTAADSTVTPAVIVRPVLPKDPPLGVPADKIGTIDIVVDEQGDVLHVKLISPGNRYHERMLVSAAKMWKFRPAYKDGKPVRYKARVRLTI